jgi:hypothetical protein
MSKALLRPEVHGEIGTALSSRGDRLATKPAKSSAYLSPNGLQVKVSARLSPDGLQAKVSPRLSSDSLRAKSQSTQVGLGSLQHLILPR